MSNEIIKVIDELAKRFGIIIDWTSENVMPYLLDLYERFIAYHITMDVIWILGYLVFMGVSINIILKSYKAKGDNFLFNDYDSGKDLTPIGLIVIMFVAIASAVGTLITIGVICELFELIFIPEVYTMDWITSYIS